MYAKPRVPGRLTAGGVRRPKAAATREGLEGDPACAGKGRLRARAADDRGQNFVRDTAGSAHGQGEEGAARVVQGQVGRGGGLECRSRAQISSEGGESQSTLAANDPAAQPSQRSGVCLVQ